MVHGSPRLDFPDSLADTWAVTLITGTVEGGVVKLPREADWSDGAKVRVELLEPQPQFRRRFASADLVGSVDGDGVAATNERVRQRMRCGR